MLTLRGRWLVVLAVVGTIFGLLRSQHQLALLSLSILIWLFGEWVNLRYRLVRHVPGFCCVRSINGQESPPGLIWTDRPLNVQVEIISKTTSLDGNWRFKDSVPENLSIVGDGACEPDYGANVCRFSYQVVPRGVGTITLPGVSVELTDPCQFMTARRFISCRQDFRVFPSFVDVDDVRPTLKRVNALPPPGIHRLKREGMGFELHELREYQPGDPPKSIAWKVSARRDQLMTRKYESEVPVRTVIFLDRSIGTRLGGFGRRLQDQMSFVAASVARSALSARDPVGLVLFDEAGSRRIDPGVGERHFHRLLNVMNQSASESPPAPTKLSRELFETVWTVCLERFPELLEPQLNVVPFTWLPILRGSRERRSRRTRIAALFAQRYGLPLDTQIQLVHDDPLMAMYSHRFLLDAGMAWMEPVVDRRGRGFHECVPRLEALSAALTQAVARGRDNELFVILADVMDCSSEISQLKPALRLVLARHHRMAVICPSPDFRRPGPVEPLDFREATPEEYLVRAEQLRLNDSAEKIRRTLGGLGIAVTFSADRQAIKMVLAEADLTRHGRMHRGAALSVGGRE
ncbi:MAG: DUF58 domain-containing protein [Planctomycetaceae bacterium]|nr:DUF58 domain-containing protein [Planctomycetaceae bacterium]